MGIALKKTVRRSRERERDVWRLSNSHIGDKKDGKQSEKND